MRPSLFAAGLLYARQVVCVCVCVSPRDGRRAKTEKKKCASTTKRKHKKKCASGRRGAKKTLKKISATACILGELERRDSRRKRTHSRGLWGLCGSTEGEARWRWRCATYVGGMLGSHSAMWGGQALEERGVPEVPLLIGGALMPDILMQRRHLNSVYLT